MEKAEKAVPAGLLTLPRELRNQIYEELLCLDEFQVQQFRPGRTLDPKILGVNRQIFHEASEMLYEKNGWITVAATDWICDAIARARTRPGNEPGFPGCAKPISRYENDQLSKSAILGIRLHRASDAWRNTTDLVVPLAAMPRFCRLLTQAPFVHSLDIYLHLSLCANAGQQTRLLGYIGQARGFRRVLVTSTEPHWAMINAAHSMQHPYTLPVEISHTVSAYQKISQHELSHGRILSARNFAQDGADFLDWWGDNVQTHMDELDEIDTDKLVQARADIGFSCAALYIQMASVDLAKCAIKMVLESLFLNDRLTDTHRACAHYFTAQSYEAVGWKNAALYSYLEALRMRPGYQDTDAAVDRMEQNLGSGTALEDAIIKHNIDSVLKPLRHQPSDSTVVSEPMYRTIFQAFHGTAAEIRSLDERTDRKVSKHRNKPSDALLIMQRATSYI